MGHNDYLSLKILTDPNGEKVSLKGMSLEAAKAFQVLLAAATELIANSPSAEGIKITIKEGSAGLRLSGTPEQIDILHTNFTAVKGGLSDNADLVKAYRNIQKVFQEPGLVCDSEFYLKGEQINLTSSFKEEKQFRLRHEVYKKEVKTIFLEGHLVANGGIIPNLHVNYNGIVKIIKCNEQQAKQINQKLYEKVYVSVFVISGQKNDTYHLCDYYATETDYGQIQSDFEACFKYPFGSVKAFYELLKYITTLIEKRKHTELARFVRLFLHEKYPFAYIKALAMETRLIVEPEEELAAVLEILNFLYLKKMPNND